MSVSRRVLYRLATSDIVESSVLRARVLEAFCYRKSLRYVAGRGRNDVVEKAKELTAAGMAVSVDYFGEGSTDPERVEATTNEYLLLCRDLAGLEGDVSIEVVPSHLGIDLSTDFFCKQIERLAESLDDGMRIEVSAEESRRTGSIIDAEEKLAEAGVPIISTIQANLKRSRTDAERLVTAGSPIRLVKGAYVESPDVAHHWGEETDLSYLRIAHQIHDAGGELFLATHDPVIREALLASLRRVGVEMLLGVREDDAHALVTSGIHVRIYVPYGDRWFRYWMRRFAQSRNP